jgi:hypothetical protein
MRPCGGVVQTGTSSLILTRPRPILGLNNVWHDAYNRVDFESNADNADTLTKQTEQR